MKNVPILAVVMLFLTVNACHQNESVVTPEPVPTNNARLSGQPFRVLKATNAQIKRAGLRKLSAQEVKTLTELVQNRPTYKVVSKGDVSKLPDLAAIKRVLANVTPNQVKQSETGIGGVGVNETCDDCGCPDCNDLLPGSPDDELANNRGHYGAVPADGTYEYSVSATFDAGFIYPDPVVTVQWDGNGQNTTSGFQVSLSQNTSFYGGSATMDTGTFRAAITDAGTMMFSFNVALVVGYVTESGAVLGSSQVVTISGAISAGGVGEFYFVPL